MKHDTSQSDPFLSGGANDDAIEVLSRHGKTFRFAGIFLEKKQLKNSARLYRFCRFADDLADHTSPSLAGPRLRQIKTDLEIGASEIPMVQDFLNLTTEENIDRGAAIDLINGLQMDLGMVSIETDEDLIQYCYHVAGTVGLLMCGVLGVTHSKAYQFAIYLGIAMQLTNIARDIEEDAISNRIYVPNTWVNHHHVEEFLAGVNEAAVETGFAIKKMLDLADRYYQSGISGLGYLPRRARFPILVAARLYQAIGTEIRKLGYAHNKGRCYVGKSRKVFLTLKSLQEFIANGTFETLPKQHTSELHHPLKDYPLAYS
ncbi:phytoene/squalene synthase family protein [Opitutia bacterium ISCC 51]|nr:phytoene/squalene synthase family protein [Opitutae bacterium ISCC 51]QXD27163.1 phytoene/squalene synthase family protein [Opitutae bacterium ISCC 52]